jgi:hypothetical protein
LKSEKRLLGKKDGEMKEAIGRSNRYIEDLERQQAGFFKDKNHLLSENNELKKHAAYLKDQITGLAQERYDFILDL